MKAAKSKDVQAAAIIVTTLRKRNRRDRFDLEEALAKRDLQHYYVQRGVRKVRDAYGDNALVGVWEDGNYLYVLDPSMKEGTEWSGTMMRRVGAEAVHVLEVLDWLAAEHGNAGVVRRARRYARNLVDEVTELVEVLDEEVAKNGVSV